MLLVAGCRKLVDVELPKSQSPFEQSVITPSPGRLTVSGEIFAAGLTNFVEKAAVIRVRFYGDRSNVVVSTQWTAASLRGARASSISAGPRGLRFSKSIDVPSGAVRTQVFLMRVIDSQIRVRGLHVDFQPNLSGDYKWRMSIVSVSFLLFCFGGLFLYFVFPGVAKPWFLLLLSVTFYSFFGLGAFAFVLASALSVWLGGLAVNKVRGRLVATWIVVFNVILLVAAKYLCPAVSALCASVNVEDPSFSIVLPLGISFYTLQAISYIADVFRKTIPPERNPAKLLLYLLFFPTIMQGPISRYGQLGHQLWVPHQFDWERMHSGLSLALWGFFKKMVIADRAAMLVDCVFDPGSTVEGFAVALGVFCYAIQIYADFSGCVDICRGVAEVLGIDLVQNFRQPYFSTSIKDFWRRWHISLSSWLKDYIYIPIGGNRHGSFRKYLNVLVVFGVSGIWHGVGLNFFVWGLLHGLYQVFDGLTAGLRAKALAACKVDSTTFSFRLGQRLVTFVLVAFAWIFFRAPTCADAWSVVERMFVWDPWSWTDGSYLKHGLDGKDLDVLAVSLIVLLLVSVLQARGSVRQMLRRQTLWFRWAVYLCGIFSILVLGVYGPNYNALQFIYMQF